MTVRVKGKKQCDRCLEMLPLSSFASRVGRSGVRLTFPWCSSCVERHLTTDEDD